MPTRVPLQLRGLIAGEERRFPLEGEELRIGRGLENDLVLSDVSVSRFHAVVEREGSSWSVHDLQSTNGIRVNGKLVKSARLTVGDALRVGSFEFQVEPARGLGSGLGPGPGPDWGPIDSVQGKVANATIVRPLADFTAQYRIEGLAIPPGSRREASPELDYAQRIVSLMTRLASLLISADVVPEVLERAMGIAFEALTVDRGFILLRDDDGQVRCALARWGDQVEHSPQEEVPVSRTIVETVMEDRVALLTHDALADERFALGESIRVHGIRSAMCVPLWSGERIIGVLQVDSPLLVGRFEQRDLDFVTAVANYTAVAVERLRNGERIQVEQRLRSRLERYHSPVVIEEILKQEESAGPAGLRMTEATVLFADLVGFTALAEELPATEVADLLRNFFNDAADAIFATSGTLDKFIGDCVMAFFGAPIEQPDHAQRAVRAALAILEAQAERNERRQEQGLSPLLCRIAINSGPVVVGDVGSDGRVDYTVLGNTVNVAARLEQSVAEAGQVVIGPETSRLLAGAWPLVSLGPQRLKGLQQTITAYRVLEPEKP